MSDNNDFMPDVNEKSKDKKKLIYLILLVFFVIVFLASVVILALRYFSGKKSAASEYKRDVDLSSENLPDNPVDFKALQENNDEVVAWLTVPSSEETIIDYPVLQSSFETEENFYINHDIDKKYSRAGSIYIQKDNDGSFTDFNTVLYGHNMLNKSMFGTLKKYRNAEYFNNNRDITVCVPGHVFEYEIVSAFIFDDRLIPAAYNNFMDDEQKLSFIETCKNPSTLVKNIAENFDVTTDDRIITLSTCTSADTERYLVVAKLVKDIKTK